MNSARKVTKRDFNLLSDLVFETYTTREVKLENHYVMLRSLTTKEREDISRCYRYLPSKYNIMLVLDILCCSILYVDGLEFYKQKHEFIFRNLNSKLVFKLYEEYKLLDDDVAESSKFIDYYVESRESRNMWAVFKTCSRIQDAFSIRKLNQYQYYWITSNVYKDSLENEKKTWAKVEYITNSICGFINPKALRKSKSGSSIVEQLEDQEDKVKQRIVDELEFGEKQQVVESNDVFSSMERQNEEDDEQYESRINILMERTLKGELVDDHDKIVRTSEINFLKKFLREKRIQVLVEREVYIRRGIDFDSGSILENEASLIQLEEDKQKGFFHDDFSYLEIVMMKDFAAVTKEEKQIAFEEVMSEQIDIDNEVNLFLKSLSGRDDVDEQTLNLLEQDTISVNLEYDSENDTDSNNEEEVKVPIRSAASQAAGMKIDIEGVDLLKQRQEKMQRAVKALNRRSVGQKKEDDSNLDVMKFD